MIALTFLGDVFSCFNHFKKNNLLDKINKFVVSLSMLYIMKGCCIFLCRSQSFSFGVGNLGGVFLSFFLFLNPFCPLLFFYLMQVGQCWAEISNDFNDHLLRGFLFFFFFFLLSEGDAWSIYIAFLF